jgi:prepilin-type N-terminal cleavage/methylation domain-containing protein
MASPARQVQGFTLTELVVTLIVIAVIIILGSLAVPHVTSTLVKGGLIQAMSNGRQIHMATMAMAADGNAKGDPSLGWPGDMKARGRIATLSDFANVLVRGDYLKPGDLKVFSWTGYQAYKGTLTSGSNGVLSPAFGDENCAFKVFLVKDEDPANTVFLATKNYTYNTALNDPKTKPFGEDAIAFLRELSRQLRGDDGLEHIKEGFVVLRKGGDASILKKQQARRLEWIGTLPGGETVESAENCLNPTVP